MHYLEYAARWFFTRIDRSVALSDTETARYRILLGLFLLLFYLPSFQWIGGLPNELFFPPPLSIAAPFGAFPPHFFFVILDVILATTAAALSLGVRSRIAGIVFAISWIVGFSFYFSFGKIDHSILLPVAVLCFCLSDWGCKYALVPDRPRGRSWLSPTLLAIFISFGMLTAGYYKLRGWVDFDLTSSGVLNWYYTTLYGGGGTLPATLVLSQPAFVYEALDYATVVFELSPLLLLLSGRRGWLLWLLLACLFHLGTQLLLGIGFLVHLGVYLPFLVPGLANSGRLKEFLRPGKKLWIPAIALLFFLHLATRLLGVPFVSLVLPSDSAGSYAIALCCCWFSLLVLVLINLRKLRLTQHVSG